MDDIPQRPMTPEEIDRQFAEVYGPQALPPDEDDDLLPPDQEIIRLTSRPKKFRRRELVEIDPDLESEYIKAMSARGIPYVPEAITSLLPQGKQSLSGPCTTPGCDLPRTARGLCSKHYHRQRRARRAV